ncbi:MAG: hypothetical protein K5905_07090 [Roseibium sp.]|uniref:hypothetical protein n=1 Tax=Roseibium sp. TaxID=1936156 RepID=UPI00262F1F84|nr:hypothetical protein [Roseibium sp.]MCV0425220.1 hypothetical protein [Roseibium sp.]
MRTLKSRNGEQVTVPIVLPISTRSGDRKPILRGNSLFMMACCVAMVAGTGILLLSAPAGQALGKTLMLATPMLGCLGMHVLMHRFMGKSCHAPSRKEKQDD